MAMSRMTSPFIEKFISYTTKVANKCTISNITISISNYKPSGKRFLPL